MAVVSIRYLVCMPMLPAAAAWTWSEGILASATNWLSNLAVSTIPQLRSPLDQTLVLALRNRAWKHSTQLHIHLAG